MAKDISQDGVAASADPGVIADGTAVVRFAIDGALRFLSHAETLRFFERACSRAGIPVKYSQGFNPHPRQSLPLPRAVGVAAAAELLVLRVFAADGFPLAAGQEAARGAWQNRMRDQLQAEMVPGLTVEEVRLVRSRASFHPVSARYVFTVASVEGLQDKIADLLAAESLVLDRVAPGRSGGRRVDVRPFLKTVWLEGTQVMAECGISDAGSIRVDEIMTLLDRTPLDLTAPIQRTHVAWETTESLDPQVTEPAERTEG